jgi:hypothetical protein
MSYRCTLSIDNELSSLLANHPDRKKHKTETAFIRAIVKDWLDRNSGQLLTAIQDLLTPAELKYIAEQHDKEVYHYEVCKQFKKDIPPARTLLEITKEIYSMKRNIFKELALPALEELESRL